MKRRNFNMDPPVPRKVNLISYQKSKQKSVQISLAYEIGSRHVIITLLYQEILASFGISNGGS